VRVSKDDQYTGNSTGQIAKLPVFNILKVRGGDPQTVPTRDQDSSTSDLIGNSK